MLSPQKTKGTEENNAWSGYAERNRTAEGHRSGGPGAESLTEGPSVLIESGGNGLQAEENLG